jgi:signal transduction histidine kinase
LPIPLFLAAILVLRAVDLPGSYDSVFLVIALNVAFGALVSLFVAYLIANSFLVCGTPGLLLLGCGVVLWGTAGVLGTVAAWGDANISVTIHNSCIGLSALCHMAGACLSLGPRRALSPTRLWLPAAYAAAAVAVTLITLSTLAGWMPPFFVQGQGGTLVRQIVLVSAFGMFAVTALLLGATGRKPLSPFAYWYALALAMIAVGLLGVMLQSSRGSAIGWVGRTAQFLGGLYMLIAAVASVRESHAWEISLEAALSQSEERYRALVATLETRVAQRTAELEQRTRQLKKLALELAQAEDRERERIAAILHEDLQQQIAGAKFHLSLLTDHDNCDSQQQAAVAKIDEMLRDAIEKSRCLSHELSPAVLYHNDLVEALHWLAGQMQAKHDLTVYVDAFEEVSLHSDALTIFLFRAAQEMLFNVVQHAGVREAAIRVDRRGRYVRLSVSDQGRGFDPRILTESAGFGLLSIRERSELLGGRMKIRSGNGAGSMCRIVIPDDDAAGTDVATSQ